MRLVHNHVPIAQRQVLLHALDNVLQGRQVAVHAVERLDGDEDVPPALSDLPAIVARFVAHELP